MISYIKGEHRLRVFESRILSLILRSKKDGNGEWRRLQNEELLSWNRSPNIVRVINLPSTYRDRLTSVMLQWLHLITIPLWMLKIWIYMRAGAWTRLSSSTLQHANHMIVYQICESRSEFVWVFHSKGTDSWEKGWFTCISHKHANLISMYSYTSPFM